MSAKLVDIRQGIAKLGRVTLAGFRSDGHGGRARHLLRVGGLVRVGYYRRRRAEVEAWKIQPRRFTEAHRRRAEIALSVTNLAAASLVSGLLA